MVGGNDAVAHRGHRLQRHLGIAHRGDDLGDVGLAISLFQALTQIQEMTLTYVPKIVAIMLAMILLLPFMLATLTSFTERLFDRVVSG